LSGKWLLTLVLEGEISQPWMLEIKGDEGSYAAKVVDSLMRSKTDIRGFRHAQDQVYFEVARDDESWPFDGVMVGDRVQGSIEFRDRLTLAWLERTSLRSMRSIQPSAPLSGSASYEAAQRADDPKELVRQLLQFVEREADSPLAFDALRVAFRMSRRAESSTDQLSPAVERYQDLSKAWGKRWSERAAETIALDLATADGPDNEAVDRIGLELALSARGALPDDAPGRRRQTVDLAYSVALVRNDRAEEGKQLLDELISRAPDEGELRYYAAQAAEKLNQIDEAIELLLTLWPHPLANRELERIWQNRHGSLAGLQLRLDEQYLQRYPPIEVEPFAGREDSASNHVVLAELFTGTSCPPCVAADVAFEALGRAFQPSQLVLLQYHLHVPGPDPLTNADAIERAQYYKVPGTPFTFFNGRESILGSGGGPRQNAPSLYAEYRTDVERQLDGKSEAKIKLNAQREHDVVAIAVTVSDIAEPGEKLRLRLALVEKMVRFNGRNGVRLHHSVVRAMPSGVQGIAVTEANLTHRTSIDVAKLRESLEQQLSEFERQVSQENRISFQFPGKPLDLNHLGVAAFLQDDNTQTVLQAAFVDLGEVSE
jgi:hypothetical protein